MRLGCVVVLAVTGLVGAAVPVSAGGGVGAVTGVTGSDPTGMALTTGTGVDSVATAPRRTALLQAILDAIEVRTDAKPSDPEKSWLSELAGYYGAPDAKALFSSDSGLTQAGLDMRNELRRAAEWGLEPNQFDVPEPPVGGSGLAAVANAELRLALAATKYAWHARGGRVDPSKLSLWLDQQPRVLYAGEVMSRLVSAKSVSDGLRSFHPRHAGFERLRQAYLVARGLNTEEAPAAPANALSMPESGPRLMRNARHPDVVLVRKILGVSADPEDLDRADPELIDAVHDFMYDRGYRRKFSIDNEVRAELNRGVANFVPRGKNRDLVDTYIVNMERWRWLPDEMGALHVWNNLPEFTSRVIKGGSIIHEERIIIGQPHTQTPVFSDQMSHVIFNPEWGMPESIKIRQLLGSLRGGDHDVIRRRGLKIVGPNGKEMSARRLNWSKVNIRDVSIIQGAGPGNPLGRLKFIFPNAHDVYMHDTPDKNLFESKERTFSHGCMRLRNPARMAEVILGEVRGWTPEDVKKNLAQKNTVQIDLPVHVPVHVTYFTLMADGAGNVSKFKDVYGHDKRILDAIKGTRTVQQIAASDPALAQKKANKELTQAAATGRLASARRSTKRVAAVSALGYPVPAAKYGAKKPFPAPAYLKKPKPFFFFLQ